MWNNNQPAGFFARNIQNYSVLWLLLGSFICVYSYQGLPVVGDRKELQFGAAYWSIPLCYPRVTSLIFFILWLREQSKILGTPKMLIRILQ